MSIYSANAIVRDFSGKLVGIRQRTRYIPDTIVLDYELSISDIAILELFAFQSDPEVVYERFCQLDFKSGISSLYEDMCRSEPSLQKAEAVHLHIGKGSVQCEGFVFNRRNDAEFLGRIDLTDYAAKDPRVAVAILSAMRNSLLMDNGICDYQGFLRSVEELRNGGLVLPDVGSVNWGDFRRLQPMCQFFGFMRGTPIDRYYLNRFVESIRGEVKGKVLEIGGERKNREIYGFTKASEYRTLDLPGWSDDIVGNAEDPQILSEGTFDSVVIFNVLEHCEEPRIVVDNIYKWLKPGGSVFVLVPCAQRIHPTPRDYWRFMPDALRSMFKAYRRQKITTYGNITTVIASFHGMAVEELTAEEMDFVHPDYPVVACLVARKPSE